MNKSKTPRWIRVAYQLVLNSKQSSAPLLCRPHYKQIVTSVLFSTAFLENILVLEVFLSCKFTSSLGSSTEVLFMYLIERGYGIIMLAQDEIDCNEAERLEHVAEMSLIYRKC